MQKYLHRIKKHRIFIIRNNLLIKELNNMKTLEIYKTRKDELTEKTIELMTTALSGDRANRTFFFKFDKETGELTVDYLYYAGLIELGDNCFYTIKDHETPDYEDYGYDSLEDMDFDACGFSEHIKYAIEEKIDLIEIYEHENQINN